jgi:hypothetical protein
MIFRHFEDEQSGHSYLIASPRERVAAIVNPTPEAIARYRVVLAELGLRLACTLRTERNNRCAKAAHTLESLTGARPIAPTGAAGHVDATDTVVAGNVLPLGDLRIEVVEPPPGYAGTLAYRISHYTFAGTSVLIDFHEAPTSANGEPAALLDQVRSVSAPGVPEARTRPIENFRTSREGVCVERMILEDLHTSLAESRFTPKEERVVRTYIRTLEETGLDHPSAAALAERLGNVDRTGVHVLVHNIRWKQIDLNRLPLVLAGQTSKWLRGLQTRPEFTPHEREFLGAYLRLLDESGRPPSGPEIAAALGKRRSVQWVRKRAHTIRRKQREFGLPELVLSRKSPAQEAPAREESRRPARGAFTHGARPGSDREQDLDLRYGA